MSVLPRLSGREVVKALSRDHSLQLADVYHVIGYYLRRQKKVEAYLKKRSAQAGTVREENEHRFDPQGVRDRLLARRTEKGRE